MDALRPFDIFLTMLEIRYVAYGNECRLHRASVISLALPIGQRISSALAPYRVADISSDASAAHIDVESSCEAHDRLDMGQEYKRYIFMPKTGGVKPKGIF